MNVKLYELSNPQKSIWYTEQYYKGTPINNIGAYVYFKECINFDILKQAVNEVVKSNDNFRLILKSENNKINQSLCNYVPFDIDIIEVSSEEDVIEKTKEFTKIPFNVENNLLFKFWLFRLPNNEGGVIINIHHLISDSWTLGLISKEIAKTYSEMMQNNYKYSKKPSYLEYLEVEKEYLGSPRFNKDKDYWKEKFETLPESISLPSSNNSIKKDTSNSSIRKQFKINENLFIKIKDFCTTYNISLYNFFMSIYSIYISKICNTNDFVLGTPILNRLNHTQKNTMGMFISTIPLRINLNCNLSFMDFIKNVGTNIMTSLRHQRFSYQDILQMLREGDSSISNLYNILISYQITKSVEDESNLNYSTNWINSNYLANELQIHLFDINDENTINIAYDYLIDKYNNQDILDLHSRIIAIINQVLDNNNLLLKDIEIVTEEEKQKILYDFNNTKADYPKDKTIVDLFEEQVNKTPDNVALTFENEKLTYKELNEKVNQVANYLNSLNLTNSKSIGIFTNRSITSIIEILAILKLGKAIVPIDPLYPIERISYMIEKSGIKYILSDSSIIPNISDNIQVLSIESEKMEKYSSTFKMTNKLLPSDNLYVIFTSGSTGKPKGVMISHKNIINLISFEKNRTPILEKNSKILQFATMSFDVSYQEIFSALLTGNTLVLISDENRKNISKLLETISINKITTLFIPPAYLRLLVEDSNNIATLCKSLKYIITAGEPLLITEGIKELLQNNIRIFNHYGPAETHVVTTYEVPKNTLLANSPIGRPINNSFVYILDNNNRLCPKNVIGQISISGECVGNGYINEDLNKNKFIQNPFNANYKLYLTGDLGYLDENNLIHFVGRQDFQVKINGFRIELGEISKCLLNCSSVTSCISIINEVNNKKYIYCYYTAKDSISEKEIISFLKSRLPQYMIPHKFIKLDKLPLNNNGKVDRKKLPILDFETNSEKFVLPRNKTDEVLISLLKKILGVNKISINDSFFELGGDSLSAINLCAKIQESFSVQLFVKDILENPIISDLSDFILSQTKENNSFKILKAPKADYYPLSSAQKRIYYSSKKFSDKNLLYNVSGAFLVNSLLDISKIQSAFDKILELHPSFRTRFVLKNNELVQEILDIKHIDIKVSNDSEKNIHTIVDNFPKPFDLSTAPLLRVSVCILDNCKTLILLDTHHIITDGVSLNILLRDFCKLYNNEIVLSSDYTYIDYAVWENNYLKSDNIKVYEKYWSSQFPNDNIPLINLPYDYSANNKDSYHGDSISFKMDKDVFSKFKNLAKVQNISEYSLFLAALYILLYKYTGQTDLIIASPFANRNYEEFSNVIGMFVNNIVLRKQIDPANTITSFIKSVQSLVSDSLSNQPYPFDLVLKNLTNTSSLMDIVLTYQNIKKDNFNIDNYDLNVLTANTKTSKFNIWMEIIPDINTFKIEYNSDLFKKETIQSFFNHYLFILNQILENINVKIEDVDILTKEEIALLDKFNDTTVPTNNDTIASIFEDVVKRHANDIALICDGKTLTYDELNKKINSLANYLIKKGIGANDIVCIMTNRSFETIICMMGILKAGAAFFNVDPTYPIERTKYYIEDSKTRYVLTQRSLKDKVKEIENCIEIDLDIDNIYNKDFDNPNIQIGLNDLSYLIYTSGSTGQPKGTMLTQLGLANMVKAMTLCLDYLKEENAHCIASVTSTPFDIFVYEIMVSLTHGLRVVMATNAEHRNPKLLDSLIRKYDVDVMTVTPSLMKINYDNREPNSALANVKNMVFGGEPLPVKFVQDLKNLANDITIYNIYGPSEITVLSNVQNLNNEKEITVGPPIMNTQIHILDKNMKRVPIGVVGEIYISGIQVGLGYIGKEKLTKERFLNNPFGPGRIYKSGDIGRWTFDGKVQCLGRIDHQVKLRGLRIELGEIENTLSNIKGISSAIVNKVQINDKEFLCGYYVSDFNISESLIRETLRKSLPPYMIPTYFVHLKEMPYSINRKIDRKALPLPDINKSKSNNKVNIEELNSNEEKLLQIWKNILKIDNISINDNFFDLGGDSVSAISMQIEAVKYGLNFEYSDIFEHPTIKELSKKSNKSNEDFLKNYDYKKLESILNKNNLQNLELIKKAKIKNILLIGATGYLGAHILDSFLMNNSGDIYCLVRSKNNVNYNLRLKNTLNFYFSDKYSGKLSERIHVVYGDITKPNLGLSNEDSCILRDNVDAVINSAALVKHYGIKEQFEEINVFGTQNIIDYCFRENKRLLHISTTSISGNGEKDETIVETPENMKDKKIFTERDIYVGQNITGVYSTTKFRSELLVLEAISKGLNAQILRLGNITNRYLDGLFQENVNENAFAKRLKSFIEMGAFPEYLLPHSIELTPVDLATDAIIKILNFESPCNIFHIYNTNLLPIKLLVDTLREDLQINLIPLPNKLLKDVINGILSDNERKDILSGIIYDLDNNKNLIYTSRIRLNSDFTEKYLDRIGFHWKKIDKDYIIRYMKYFEKIDFIKGD